MGGGGSRAFEGRGSAAGAVCVGLRLRDCEAVEEESSSPLRTAMSTPVVPRYLQLPPSQRAQSAFRGEGRGGDFRARALGQPEWGVDGSWPNGQDLGSADQPPP